MNRGERRVRYTLSKRRQRLWCGRRVPLSVPKIELNKTIVLYTTQHTYCDATVFSFEKSDCWEVVDYLVSSSYRWIGANGVESAQKKDTARQKPKVVGTAPPTFK